MKNRLKKMSAAVMALVVLVTTVACGKNKILEQTDIIAEQCGLEETDDIDRVLKDVAGTQDYTEQVYLKADGAEAAQPVYDVIFNRSNTYPKAEVTSIAVMYTNVLNSDGYAIRENAYVMTFKNSKKASEFYGHLLNKLGVLNFSKGKDGNVRYGVYKDINENFVVQQGIYNDGKTVVVFTGNGQNINDFMLSDRICNVMNLIAPDDYAPQR